MTMKEDIQELKELILQLQDRINKLEQKNKYLPYPQPYEPRSRIKKKCSRCNGTGQIDDWGNSSHPHYFD